MSIPYFHTWCGLSANLECMSKMCCRPTRLAENTGRKKSPFLAPSHNFVGLYLQSQLRHISTMGKIVKQQYLRSTCPDNMVNIGPLAAEICWRVSGTSANFNEFRVLAALLHEL